MILFSGFFQFLSDQKKNKVHQLIINSKNKQTNLTLSNNFWSFKVFSSRNFSLSCWAFICFSSCFFLDSAIVLLIQTNEQETQCLCYKAKNSVVQTSKSLKYTKPASAEHFGRVLSLFNWSGTFLKYCALKGQATIQRHRPAWLPPSSPTLREWVGIQAADLLREGEESFSCMWIPCPGGRAGSSSTISPQEVFWRQDSRAVHRKEGQCYSLTTKVSETNI